MTTCRVLITSALRDIRVLAPGDEPHVDDLTTGLAVFTDLIGEIHNARGPLLDVDVTAATYVPSEDQRIRVQLGDTATVTLPNAIPIYASYNPYDYGFSPPVPTPPVGTTAIADGLQYRQPRDGARIEIVGTTNALYFYRADINTWTPAYGLTLDMESPLNARHNRAFSTMLAAGMSTWFPQAQLPPLMMGRIGRARASIFMQAGTSRDPVRADYL